jgi:hypothetical protein
MPRSSASAVLQMLEVGCVVVCDQGGVKGMASAICAESWFGPTKVAQELFWWSEGCGCGSPRDA